MGQGLYSDWSAPTGDENKLKNIKFICDKIKDYNLILEAFNVNEENFSHMFHVDFVMENFKDKVHEYPSDLEHIFSEIYVSYITILLMSEKEEYTFNIIDKGIHICKELNLYSC